MKIFLAFFLLMLQALGVQAAKTVYITDHFEVPLYSGKDDQFKVLSNLETGAALTLIKSDKGDGWTQVRTAEKQTGWIASRYLTEAPIARAQLDAQNQNFETLERENREHQEELITLNARIQESIAENDKLTKEKNRLAQEVASIREAASDTIKIMEERDQLQENVINLNREVQGLKHENQALKDNTDQDRFLRGAGVLFGGIVLGLILQRPGWRRRSRGWDSF